MRTFTLALLICLCLPLAGFADQKRWDPIPPADFSKIKLDDFTDDELDLPYYLSHFHEVVAGVVEEGPTRGFMSIPVWRGRDKNQQAPYNARVMESHLTLAFFYCTDRPWNPYFGSPAVRQRLEAMLTFWCDMQNDDGRFSEYGPKQWNLPATAFATKFMGQTLTLLRRSGDKATIDPSLLKRVIDADRKAILAVLTRDDLYEHGKTYTNQFLNIFAGAAAYMDLFPDDKEIAPLMAKKFADAERDFLSPCGYYYEADGPDFGYTLHTTHSDLEMACHYLRGQAIGDAIERQDRRWNEWLGYNLLRQPDGSTFVFNRGIQTRQSQPNWDRQDGALCERVEEARAFATSREERQKWAKDKRAELAASWGKFPDLPIGRPGYAVSPYTFLHREHTAYYPPQNERDAAVAKLPYLARDRFIHQRIDSRAPAVFTYIRRPSYYAAFNAGPIFREQQRLGVGVIWLPGVGTVLQSQTNSDDHAWGTRAADGKQVYEASELTAAFQINGKDVVPAVGNKDLPHGTLTITYKLGDRGRKTIVFDENSINVIVDHAGKFTEQVPLLAGDGLEVRTMQDVQRSTIKGRTLFADLSVQTLKLSATDRLNYQLIPRSR